MLGGMPRRLLVDTSSLLYRAFYALPRTLVDDAGAPTGALRGYLDMLARVLRDRGPSEVIHVFDAAERPAARVAAWPGYKAAREAMPDELSAQFVRLREILGLLGASVATAPGWEADDAIAALTAATPTGSDVEILTGDRDLLQLVRDGDPQVRVLWTRRGVADLDVLDAAAVEERYGVAPERYADYATLRGDPSDGLPGVRGIGEVTAGRLLARHGTLEGILAAGADLTAGQRRNLDAAHDYLEAMQEVVPVRRDVEVTVHTGTPAAEVLEDLAERGGFSGPLRRLRAAMVG